MPAFDPATILGANLDQPMVKRPPVPVNEYLGVFGDPVTRTWVSPKDPTKSGIAVDIPVELSIPADVADRVGLREPTIKLKYGVMLDLTPTGTIDQAPGANAGLRRLREALDKNKPGDTFSFNRDVAGRTAKFKVGHREYPEGSGDLFEDIVGIARA